MIGICRTLFIACIAPMSLAGLTAHAQPLASSSTEHVFESTSSGLITLTNRQTLRVAVVLAAHDDAIVGTVVRFIDASGNVIKRQRGDVHGRQSLVAELTDRDLGGQVDVLVRIEVVHELPGVRTRPYPLLVTVQTIPPDGIGGLVANWNGGTCGCPTCGPPTHPGNHVDCEPTTPTDM